MHIVVIPYMVTSGVSAELRSLTYITRTAERAAAHSEAERLRRDLTVKGYNPAPAEIYGGTISFRTWEQAQEAVLMLPASADMLAATEHRDRLFRRLTGVV